MMGTGFRTRGLLVVVSLAAAIIATAAPARAAGYGQGNFDEGGVYANHVGVVGAPDGPTGYTPAPGITDTSAGPATVNYDFTVHRYTGKNHVSYQQAIDIPLKVNVKYLNAISDGLDNPTNFAHGDPQMVGQPPISPAPPYTEAYLLANYKLLTESTSSTQNVALHLDALPVGATDADAFAETEAFTLQLTIPNCGYYELDSGVADSAQFNGFAVLTTGMVRAPYCQGGGGAGGGLTMGFWHNKNGQGIITSGASTGGVCKSGTWLRQYAPFQDLSSSATCSDVAAYALTTIKNAKAGGATMNPMLKAQMLATALDTYFSDPGLGGNQISAPGPVGSENIDLGPANETAAFGLTPPAHCLSVLGMLSYAAGQSNVGGSIWYANVKATQGMAKDAFDAINNDTALTC
jgi:hypothetical protein